MKQIALLFSFICFFSFSLVSATCTDNNNFFTGDEINICAIGCKYQNENNLSQFIDCDSSVTCKFSANYPNGTNIVTNQLMTRDGTTFNYSIGNSSTDLGGQTGFYTGQISCERSKGWMPPKFFQFTISSIPDTTPPTISIINPTSSEDEKTQPTEFYVNISEDGVCEYSVDSGDRQSMTTQNNRLFHAEEILSNGEHNVIYYCEDLSNNEASSSISFTVHITGFVESSDLDLDHIELEYLNWIKDKENKIIIQALDKFEKPLELESLDIKVLNGTEVSGKKINITETGRYEVSYFLREQDITEISLKITAKQGKTVVENITIQVTENRQQSNEKLNQLLEKIKENPYPLIIFIICLIVVLAFLMAMMSKNSKK